MKPREILLLSLVAIGLIVAGIGWFMGRGSDASAAQSARNLQQWGIALNLYLIDNQNQLPGVGATPITAAQTSAWYNALPPYLGQGSLADLPPGSRPKPGVSSLWVVPGQREPRFWDNDVFLFNYAMNRALQPDATVRSFRIYEIEFPQHVVFMTEVNGYDPGVDPDTVDYRWGPGGVSPRAFANVLFCDGHVEPVPRATLTDDPAARRAANARDGVSWFEE